MSCSFPGVCTPFAVQVYKPQQGLKRCIWCASNRLPHLKRAKECAFCGEPFIGFNAVFFFSITLCISVAAI
jgi:hypothetical protein